MFDLLMFAEIESITKDCKGFVFYLIARLLLNLLKKTFSFSRLQLKALIQFLRLAPELET